MNEKTEEKLPYSYHTFVCPFSYKYSSNTKKKNKSKSRPEWLVSGWDDDLGNENEEEKWFRYASQMYFLPHIRDLLYTKKDDYCKKYSLKGAKGGKLKVTVPESEYNKECKTEYTLGVEKICLLLFENLEIGVLSFECENYNYSAIEDINRINEHVRRLYPQFFKKIKDKQKDEQENKKGDEQKKEPIKYKKEREPGIIWSEFELSIGNEIIVSEKEPLRKSPTESSKESSKDAPADGNMKVVRAVLTYSSKNDEKNNNENKSDTKKNSKLKNGSQIVSDLDKNNLQISSVLDDRMFVVCLLRKSDFLPLLKKYDSYYFMDVTYHRKFAEQLYKFAYIEETCTCNNAAMLQEKLESHIYTRWADYGTVYGITEYSMVCVTSEDEARVGDVINPFLTMYTDMVRLALAQRAALTKIENNVSDVASKMYANNKKEDIFDTVDGLWKKYVVFQSKLYSKEVTFQEQGVEIYDILRKSLLIDEMNEIVNNKLEDLHKIADVESKKNEKKLNTAMNMMAVLGGTIGFAALSQDYFYARKELDCETLLAYLVGFGILATLNLLILWLLNRSKESKTSNGFMFMMFWIIVMLICIGMSLFGVWK